MRKCIQKNRINRLERESHGALTRKQSMSVCVFPRNVINLLVLRFPCKLLFYDLSDNCYNYKLYVFLLTYFFKKRHSTYFI